jgi:hypothetical protein
MCGVGDIVQYNDGGYLSTLSNKQLLLENNDYEFNAYNDMPFCDAYVYREILENIPVIGIAAGYSKGLKYLLPYYHGREKDNDISAIDEKLMAGIEKIVWKLINN